MNRKLIALIIVLVFIPVLAYGYSLSDQYLIVKSYDSLPACDQQGKVIYSTHNQNLLTCTKDGWRLGDGTLIK